MKKKLFASLLMLFLGGALTLMAQTRTVTGKVIDQTGQGVIAAGVQEKGTTNGAITDLDGNYTITVGDGAVLVFSSIGYATQEIPVNGRSVINVTFEEDSEFLDEVVVVGYGTMKKSDLAGASVSMREEDLKGSIITNLDQSLQGRAAGVTAVQTSGAPGSSSSIRVRGQATINANAEPLYVIDGVIMQGGGSSGASFGLGDALGNGTVSTISPLSTINPADIVSMEILKDASATAIYGAQGANGVVLITTKHGKAGDAKFTYDGMVAAARQMTCVSSPSTTTTSSPLEKARQTIITQRLRCSARVPTGRMPSSVPHSSSSTRSVPTAVPKRSSTMFPHHGWTRTVPSSDPTSTV